MLFYGSCYCFKSPPHHFFLHPAFKSLLTYRPKKTKKNECTARNIIWYSRMKKNENDERRLDKRKAFYVFVLPLFQTSTTNFHLWFFFEIHLFHTLRSLLPQPVTSANFQSFSSHFPPIFPIITYSSSSKSPSFDSFSRSFDRSILVSVFPNS